MVKVPTLEGAEETQHVPRMATQASWEKPLAERIETSVHLPNVDEQKANEQEIEKIGEAPTGEETMEVRSRRSRTPRRPSTCRGV